jgi:cytosine/adenosine deaminase-related metal-dependent hydrolase
MRSAARLHARDELRMRNVADVEHTNAAHAMGVDRDSGTVAEGKYADIIAVRGDPLQHIDVLREPKVVIKHGRRYK